MVSVTSPDFNRQTIGNYQSTLAAILKGIIVHSLQYYTAIQKKKVLYVLIWKEL